MELMLLPFKRYAEFDGRSRRKEYWLFRLFESAVIIGGLIIFSLLAAAMGAVGGDRAGGIVGSIAVIAILGFVLASFIPGLAVTVRRLHDTDRSGWMILISLIPLVGPIVLLVFLLSDGSRGPNQYGQDPKSSTERMGDVFN